MNPLNPGELNCQKRFCGRVLIRLGLIRGEDLLNLKFLKTDIDSILHNFSV